MTAASLGALAAMLTAGVTAVYVWLTFRLVSLTRRQMDALQTPHLTCVLRVADEALEVAIANHSEWPAYSVRADVVAYYWGEAQVTAVLDNDIREERRDEAEGMIQSLEDTMRLGVYDRFYSQVIPARNRLTAPVICPGRPLYVDVLIFFRVASGGLYLQKFKFQLVDDRYSQVVDDRASPMPTAPFLFPATRTRVKYGLLGRIKRLRGYFVPSKSFTFKTRPLPRRIPRSVRSDGDLLEILNGHVVVPGWLVTWTGSMVEGRGDIESL